jgi:hypothetical protein
MYLNDPLEKTEFEDDIDFEIRKKKEEREQCEWDRLDDLYDEHFDPRFDPF